MKMYHVYVLKSKKNNDTYIGYSENLKQRVKTHNLGKAKSTKVNRPWILIYCESYRNKNDARKREFQLKKHYYKEELLKRIPLSSNLAS